MQKSLTARRVCRNFAGLGVSTSAMAVLPFSIVIFVMLLLPLVLVQVGSNTLSGDPSYYNANKTWLVVAVYSVIGVTFLIVRFWAARRWCLAMLDKYCLYGPADVVVRTSLWRYWPVVYGGLVIAVLRADL